MKSTKPGSRPHVARTRSVAVGSGAYAAETPFGIATTWLGSSPGTVRRTSSRACSETVTTRAARRIDHGTKRPKASASARGISSGAKRYDESCTVTTPGQLRPGGST